MAGGRPLTDMAVRKAKVGLHGDGRGLWLLVGRNGNHAKRWCFRFMVNGRAREMGLGSYPEISLAEARQARDQARKLLKAGTDPIDARKARRVAEAQTRQRSFRLVAGQCIAKRAPGWRSEGSAKDWHASFARYVYPTIGETPITDIQKAHVETILTPIWHEKANTAARVRNRIEQVLDYAAAQGWRDGVNPASLKILKHVMPAQQRRQQLHHAALPWPEVAGFITSLRRDESPVARCLELIILTGCRAGEARLARVEEVNLQERLWTIPAARMKAGRPHRIPLSDAAISLLRPAIHRAGSADFIFPGAKRGEPYSGVMFLYLLRRISYGHITTHGFRSTFRDWAAEATNYPREVAEMALAHAIPSAVEAAYRRGDLFEKRRQMMADWATHCMTAKGQVIPLRA